MQEATHACRTCGVTLVKKPGPGRWPLYCTQHAESTRPRAYTRRHRGRVRLTCEMCSVEFERTFTGQRTCSRACGERLRREITGTLYASPCSKVTWRECPVCERPYTTKARRQCGCPAPSRVPVPAPLKQRTCERCAGTFTGNGYRHYCDPCRTQVQREQNYASSRYRRRARHFGVEYEPLSTRRVFERDRWKCQLCKRAVKRMAVVPHPLAPTLDHVVPMSCGGGHTYANVQLAHFRCNSAKGAKGAQQLALVG